MTHTNRTRPHTTTAERPSPARAAGNAARRRHASDFSDAVVAAYVHELSVRARPAPRRSGRIVSE